MKHVPGYVNHVEPGVRDFGVVWVEKAAVKAAQLYLLDLRLVIEDTYPEWNGERYLWVIAYR